MKGPSGRTPWLPCHPQLWLRVGDTMGSLVLNFMQKDACAREARPSFRLFLRVKNILQKPEIWLSLLYHGTTEL